MFGFCFVGLGGLTSSGIPYSLTHEQGGEGKRKHYIGIHCIPVWKHRKPVDLGLKIMESNGQVVIDNCKIQIKLFKQPYILQNQCAVNISFFMKRMCKGLFALFNPFQQRICLGEGKRHILLKSASVNPSIKQIYFTVLAE